jgi:ketosteroid isomerase-like protein
VLKRIVPALRCKHRRIATTRAFVDAMNARDHADALPLMADHMAFVDISGKKILGRDEILAVDDAFRDANDNAQVRILTIDAHDDAVLVRGYLESEMAEVAGDTMWRVDFDGPVITAITVTRADNGMTLPKFAAMMQA